MAKLHGLSVALAAALMSAGCASLVPALPEAQPQIAQSWPMPAHGVQVGNQDGPAQVGWRDLLVDARLERVVAQALENNRDFRVAALNVERAQAQYRVRRADRIPNLGGSVSMERIGGDDTVSSESYRATLGVASFELDLFGRVRNLSEAALQQYFAQEENRAAVQIALIAEVSNAWMTLAADQSLMQVAADTLKTYDESLRLTERRHELGAVSGLQLAQARTQVETARGDLARYRGQVEQDRHALELLVGAPLAAADLPDGFKDELIALPPLPVALASEVLLQRPDIRAAEHLLESANANIGAARAAFFPSISLTGGFGRASNDLSDLFSGGGAAWSFTPSITIPIFQGGRLRANLGMATADRDIALANYEKAIQTGFREVADGLSLSQSLLERREAAERLLVNARKAEELSQARYDAGYDSYLTLLDAQRTRYAAEQALMSIRLAEQSNRIGLYRALGGGWQLDAANPAAP